MKWMKEVRTMNGVSKSPKIVPRFITHSWNGEQYGRLLSDPSVAEKLFREIHSKCNRYSFDGVVMEFSNYVNFSFDLFAGFFF